MNGFYPFLTKISIYTKQEIIINSFREGKSQDTITRELQMNRKTVKKRLLFGDKRTSLQLAVFTSAYSNYRYAYVYYRQDTLSFMEAHTRFFR